MHVSLAFLIMTPMFRPVPAVLFPPQWFAGNTYRLPSRETTRRPLICVSVRKGASEGQHHLRPYVLVPQTRALATFVSMGDAQRTPA